MPLTGQSRFKHFEPVHNTIVLVHYNNILEDIMKKLSKLRYALFLSRRFSPDAPGIFLLHKIAGD